MTIPGVFVYAFLFLFSLVALAACGVSAEKSEVTQEAAQSATDKSSELPQSGQAQPETTITADKTRQSEDIQTDSSTMDGSKTKAPSSGAQVIEPRAPEPDIKLEPIPMESPDAAIASQSAAESDAMDSTASVRDGEKTLAIAKIDPQLAPPEKPGVAIPTSTGSNHFVITVDEKDQRHPHFGEGHQMGFLINGVPGGAVTVERGKTYRFQVVTDPKHDVYVSTKSIGWGANTWSAGVEGAYIYEGTMTFTPPDSAPEVLYYACRNHPNMGGEIHVINPGEKIDIAKLTHDSGAVTSAQKAPVKSGKPEVSVAMVNQKLMFADMLVNSAASARVKASNNDAAKQIQLQAEQLVTQAKEQLKAGENQGAYANVQEGLALLKESARLVPSEEEVAVLKETHKELLHSIENFEQSHEESYQRTVKSGGKTAAVDYDKKQVASLMEEAQNMAAKNDYVNANKNLENAQHIITAAIQKMLNSQTIVYDLNFESPQEEYEYELKRFGGYEELIPIAVEQKNPNEGTKKLMTSFVEKGQNMRKIAIETAKAGDYPRAIAMIQDATTEIRRALRMVGVMQ